MNFGAKIAIYSLLFFRACYTGWFKVYGKEYSASFFKKEIACILVLSMAGISTAFFSLFEVPHIKVLSLILNMIGYWANDVALFLYAIRIWVTSADADKRSKNLYIEKFSGMTEREKLASLEPSAVHLPCVKFTKYFFIISQAVVIVAFYVISVCIVE